MSDVPQDSKDAKKAKPKSFKEVVEEYAILRKIPKSSETQPKFLSHGAYGHVFQVGPKAIKIMMVEHNPSFNLNEVTREMYVSALVAPRNPYLMPVDHLQTLHGNLLMEMPFARYGSLRDFIKEVHLYQPFLSSTKKLEIFMRVFAQCICGLHSMHNIGLAHLDLKPKNILVSGFVEEPIAQIGDFGLVSWVQGTFHRAPKDLITDYFRPPEMLRQQQRHLSMNADIWSMAIILMQVLGNWMRESKTHGTWHFTYGEWFGHKQWTTRSDALKGFDWAQYLERGTKELSSASPPTTLSQYIQDRFLGIMFGITKDEKTNKFVPTTPHSAYAKYLNQVPTSIWILLFHMLQVEPRKRWSTSKIMQRLEDLRLMPQACPPLSFGAKTCYEMPPQIWHMGEQERKTKEAHEVVAHVFFGRMMQLERGMTTQKIVKSLPPTAFVAPVQTKCILDGRDRLIETMETHFNEFWTQGDGKTHRELYLRILFMLSLSSHWGGDSLESILQWGFLGLENITNVLNGTIRIILLLKSQSLEPIWSEKKEKKELNPVFAIPQPRQQQQRSQQSIVPSLSSSQTTSSLSLESSSPPLFLSRGKIQRHKIPHRQLKPPDLSRLEPRQQPQASVPMEEGSTPVSSSDYPL